MQAKFYLLIFKNLVPRLFLGLFLLSSISYSFDKASFVKKADSLNLVQDAMWLKLLRYKKRTFSSKYKSAVRNQDFFVHQNGRFDPKNELISSIDKIFDRKVIDDTHFLCRFKARSKFLINNLKIDKNKLPKVNCKNFDFWTKGRLPVSISLIFATGYFSNPASYYGHPFLKFNFQKGKSDLLNETLNYGAITPQNPNPLVYIFKGLLGGYDAGFSTAKFYYTHHGYIENEHRDLWEYKLKLNDDQKETLLFHAWELLGQKFPYFFLADNCGYRISELLEVIYPHKITSKIFVYSVPHDLFYAVNKFKLYSSFKRVDSSETRLVSMFKTLDSKERKVIKDISKKKIKNFEESIKNLDDSESSIKIMDALVSYYSFLQTKGDNKDLKERRKVLFIKRGSIDAPKTNGKEIKSFPPHEAQNPTSTSVGYFYNEVYDSGVYVRIRPAYYDLLSPVLGRYSKSELKMLDMHFKFSPKKSWISKIDLLSVINLNTSKTNLKGEGGFSWKVRASLEPKAKECLSCVSFNLESGIGKTFELGEWGLLNFFLDGLGKSNVFNNEYLYLKPHSFLLLNISKFIRTRLYFEREYSIRNFNNYQDIYGVDLRFSPSLRWDMTLNARKSDYEELSIFFSKYW